MGKSHVVRAQGRPGAIITTLLATKTPLDPAGRLGLGLCYALWGLGSIRPDSFKVFVTDAARKYLTLSHEQCPTALAVSFGAQGAAVYNAVFTPSKIPTIF